jgi:menaquinone-9 beta-reductase
LEEQMVDVDVLVIGARVAGSILAARMGDAGASVLLVDAAGFPSPTASTHFFRGAGLVGTLEELDVLDEVLGLGAPPLTRQYFHVAGADPLEQPPQRPGSVGYALSVRRGPLDDILVRRAGRAPRVEVRPRTRMTDLVWEGDRVAGATLIHDGRASTVRARVTVGADGRASTVARLVGAVKQREEPAVRAMYYRYVTGFCPLDGTTLDAAEFSLVGDELAYVFPSDEAVTCVALSVNLDAFSSMKSRHAEAFDEHLAMHRGLTPRLERSVPLGPVVGHGPRPNVVHVPAGPGWLLIGDANLYQDPWTGYGMDAASTHARLAADAIAAVLTGGDEASAWRRFRDARDGHGLDDFEMTVGLGRDLRQLLA